MKVLLINFLIILTLNLSSKAENLVKIRDEYIIAIKDGEKANELYKQLSAIKNPDPIILAYLGSTQALLAKHHWNPVNKLSLINQAFENINLAVEKDPNQLEIRFLRFSLQYYVPTILGYNKNLITDKNKIVSLIQKGNPKSLKVDQQILKNMAHFMVNSKKCTDKEIEILKKVLV